MKRQPVWSPRVRFAFALSVILLSANTAAAQGLGVRGGANVNPDQVYVGGQYEWPMMNRVWFQPSGDVGFGNDAKLLAANLDAVYRRQLGQRPVWTAYAGGGPAVNYYRLPIDSHTDVGMNVLGGLMHARGWFTEVRVGFSGSPDFRFGAGYRFQPKRPAVSPRRPAPRRP